MDLIQTLEHEEIARLAKTIPEFSPGDTAASLKLTGHETIDIVPAAGGLAPRGQATVRVRDEKGSTRAFHVRVRVDTPEELTAFKHGGILPYVLRRLAQK